MWLPHAAFWVLLIWGLKDDDLYPKEAAIFAAIWAGFLLAFLLLKISLLWFIIPVVVLDAALILKIFGGDITIR